MLIPVNINELGYVLMAGIGILLSGSAYAFFLAMGKLRQKRYYLFLAYASYFVLCVIAFFLTAMIHLRGFWLIVPVLLLTGYLLAPYAILRLCIATYGPRSDTHNTNL